MRSVFYITELKQNNCLTLFVICISFICFSVHLLHKYVMFKDVYLT